MKRVAIVSPNIAFSGGGVRSMSLFLHRILSDSAAYEPQLISMAAAVDDPASVRLRAPQTWLGGVQVWETEWNGRSVIHVGANVSELEFQRYRPRRALTELLKRYDLIQVVAGTPASAYAITAASHELRRPITGYIATMMQEERVSLLAGLTGWRRMWWERMTALNNRFEQLALRDMDHVFALSNYTYSLLNRHVAADKLSLAIYGIDTQLFKPAESYKPDNYIISVARFGDPRKNVRLLFQAYAQLRERLPNAPRLLLVGGQPPAADMDIADELGLLGQIDIIDHANHDELAKLYQGAALFVLPSNEEGLAIVILEAMSAGLPVVSTRCGGPETTVIDGQTGFLTPLNDADTMADRLYRLVTSPDLARQMRKAALDQVEKRFSLNATKTPFLTHYDRLLSRYQHSNSHSSH